MAQFIFLLVSDVIISIMVTAPYFLPMFQMWNLWRPRGCLATAARGRGASRRRSKSNYEIGSRGLGEQLVPFVRKQTEDV